mmetsp:Transcript_24430/g.56710  ORF Transcript_24430/g.56710 Transcript_24430/m.56710 type:complete len:260 (-) Transcript_24430:69-848(-)
MPEGALCSAGQVVQRTAAVSRPVVCALVSRIKEELEPRHDVGLQQGQVLLRSGLFVFWPPPVRRDRCQPLAQFGHVILKPQGMQRPPVPALAQLGRCVCRLTIRGSNKVPALAAGAVLQNEAATETIALALCMGELDADRERATLLLHPGCESRKADVGVALPLHLPPGMIEYHRRIGATLPQQQECLLQVLLAGEVPMLHGIAEVEELSQRCKLRRDASAKADHALAIVWISWMSKELSVLWCCAPAAEAKLANLARA